MDSLPHHEQAGFQHVRSTVDQVIHLSPEIEDRFSAKTRRLVRSLSVYQHHMTSYGTVGLHAKNYFD